MKKSIRTNRALAIGALVVIAFTIAACGGGSSNQSPSQSQALESIKGLAIDGYLKNATVFLDLNENGTLDSGEPSTLTDETGSYTLKATANQLATHHVIVIAKSGVTIDQDNPNTAITQTYTLTAPIGKTEVISPITTLISSKIGDGKTLSEAETEILADFGLQNFDLYKNYLYEEQGNLLFQKAHRLATSLAEIYKVVEAKDSVQQNPTTRKTLNSQLYSASFKPNINNIKNASSALEAINIIADSIGAKGYTLTIPSGSLDLYSASSIGENLIFSTKEVTVGQSGIGVYKHQLSTKTNSLIYSLPSGVRAASLLASQVSGTSVSFVRSDVRTHIYSTSDGGRNWSVFDTHLNNYVNLITYHPKSTHLLYFISGSETYELNTLSGALIKIASTALIDIKFTSKVQPVGVTALFPGEYDRVIATDGTNIFVNTDSLATKSFTASAKIGFAANAPIGNIFEYSVNGNQALLAGAQFNWIQPYLSLDNGGTFEKLSYAPFNSVFISGAKQSWLSQNQFLGFVENSAVSNIAGCKLQTLHYWTTKKPSWKSIESLCLPDTYVAYYLLETTINHSIFITNSYGGRDNIYINPNPTVLKNDLSTN